ncbi:MAG TPA: ribosomal-protein-alanine N-acetyltransferase, partial [Dietzia timorensis]|nr:ribosomal-protein-alanine N-acetyltransferase [Dietzia timorensis]
MSEPSIAAFAPGDSGEAAALERVLFPRQDPWSEAQFRDTLGQEHVRMWAARVGDRLAGYAALGAFGPAGDREFEVFNIAVD